MVRKLWPGIAATIAAALFGWLKLPALPARVASHWGLHGEVNGWMPREVLVWGLPLLGLAVALVLAVAPRLDPKFRNFPMHAGSYWLVSNAVLVFVSAVNVVIIGYNLGWPINLNRLVGIGLGVLFIVLGNVMTRVRPNWIFGIRTPWTLTSELSWRETHRLGGYLFLLTGVAVFLTAIAAPATMMTVLMAGTATTALISIVWSYFAWRRDPAAHQET